MWRWAPSSRAGKLRLVGLLAVFGGLMIFYHAAFFYTVSRLPVLFYYFRYSPREGDVVFQSLPHMREVDVIEGITHSPFSHCGVVLRDEHNRWVVIEAIGNVHETPLFLWELRGRGGNFSAYRLDSRYSWLIPKFKNELLSFLGRPYDFDYNMSDEREIYCSDLVYLAFQKSSGEAMGKLVKLGDLDWRPYEKFIRSQQGSALPLDRRMITPADLARAPQLHLFYQTGLFGAVTSP